MKKIIILILVFTCQFIFAQDMQTKMLTKDYTSPDELVTLSANISYNTAIKLLSAVSAKKTGRTIVSIVESEEPIGVEIVNLHYLKALLIIVQYANLVIDEQPEMYVIKKKVDVKEERSPETYAPIDEREVKISAVFFEVDVEKLKERGLNWQFLLSKKGLDLGFANQGTSSTLSEGSDFGISGSGEYSVGGFFGEAVSLFRFFESEKIGEVIASPNIQVRDKTLGKIQVGSDFSIKQRDFAGNVTDFFFSTGSIIHATPYIYTENGIDYVLLTLKVERSSGFPGEISTEIRKTTAETQILMLSGEETVIGGLFLNDEKTERVGIPILKDLPWWVLGIRYLTGSDKIVVTKKELIILIKVEIMPTLRERLAFPNGDQKLKNELDSIRNKVKFYQFQNQREE